MSAKKVDGFKVKLSGVPKQVASRIEKKLLKVIRDEAQSFGDVSGQERFNAGPVFGDFSLIQ